MERVYVVYAGDRWLSTASLELIAVCDNVENVFKLIEEDAKDINEPLTDYHKEELEKHFQTQGRECNYMIEATELNILIN